MNEFYGSVKYYGTGDILRNYSAFPSWLPLPISIQHGWDILPNSHDANTQAIENWYWNDELKELYLRTFTNIEGRAVGAPFLYLLAHLNYHPAPFNERKGSIVFPSHSSALNKMECNFQEFAELLDSLPQEYKPITICIYHLDQERGLDKPFIEKGFEVVSNGEDLFDKNFLYHYIKNAQWKRYAFSNQMTSALLFASAMGLISYYFGPQFTVTNDDPHWQHLDYTQYHRDWEARYRDFFEFQNCAPDKQREFCLNVLGYPSLLSRYSMLSILLKMVFTKKYMKKLYGRTIRKLDLFDIKHLIKTRRVNPED